MSNPQVENYSVLKRHAESPQWKEAISKACSRTGVITAERQLRIMLTAAMSQPKIAEACMSPEGRSSIVKALLTATQRGLEVDGRQGHLVPFNDKRLGMIVQFIPGYQGLVDLAYNHPKVKAIWWNVVYEKDQFKFKDGLVRVLEHEKYEGDEDPGALRYAYAVCKLDGGEPTFVCLNKREILKAKSCSRGSDSEYSPWQTHPAAMWAKTAVRALCKQIPQCNELRDALADDDEVSGSESRFGTPNVPPPDLSGLEAAGGLSDNQPSGGQQEASDNDGDLGPQRTVDTTATVKPTPPTPQTTKRETKPKESPKTEPKKPAAPATPPPAAKEPEPEKKVEEPPATTAAPVAQTPPQTPTQTAANIVDTMNDDEVMTTIGEACKHLQIEEVEFCKWACKQFKLPEINEFSELMVNAPKRMRAVLRSWTDYRQPLVAFVTDLRS